MHRPLRLSIDSAALVHNWRWLADRAGVSAGAAIKADAYGLGAREAMCALHGAGCRDFFVSVWPEAEELGAVPDDASLVVLHGVGPDDVEAATLTAPDAIDHLLARDLELLDGPRPLPHPEAEWPAGFHGPLGLWRREAGRRIRLSDHAPVAATYELPHASG